MRRTWAPAAPWLVAAAAFAAMTPALSGDFIKLDDGVNFLANRHFRGLSLDNLSWVFLGFQLGGVYQPLSWVTHALDWYAWGLNPFGYHLTSLALHALDAALLWRLLRRLLALGRPGLSPEACSAAASFGALFFALHPVRVEAVAWVSNRSYPLPAAFYLLSLTAYLDAQTAPARRRARLWLAFAFFGLSLLSKAIGATLPATLLVLDVYPLRRLGGAVGWTSRAARAVWLEKAPFFALSAASILVAAAGRHFWGDFAAASSYRLGERLAQAFYGLSFYLEKTLVPAGLMPIYAVHGPVSLAAPAFAWRAAAVVAVSALVWSKRRSWPAAGAVWVHHAAALSPFLGVAKYGLPEQITSDKWFYLPGLGLSALAAAATAPVWERALARESCPLSRAAAAALAAWLALLGVLTWRQSGLWIGDEPLFLHSIAVDPECDLCHNNLAAEYNERGRYREAMEHALIATRIGRDYSLERMNLSIAYYGQGRVDDAVREGLAATRLEPTLPENHHHLAFLYAEEGRWRDAELRYRAALRLYEGLGDAGGAARAHLGLGRALARDGEKSDGRSECVEAKLLDPSLKDSPCP